MVHPYSLLSLFSLSRRIGCGSIVVGKQAVEVSVFPELKAPKGPFPRPKVIREEKIFFEAERVGHRGQNTTPYPQPLQSFTFGYG